MARKRRIRTIFYGDQELTLGELELLHTPALQRLYDLHQLGLTDRVYIDASHSRLHHVVGVVHQADRLIWAIATNLRREAKTKPRLQLPVGPPGKEHNESLGDLAAHVEKRCRPARLMGLLHDLTHSPYGHTLEDEIGRVSSKHDEPDRQAETFYRLLCQLIGWLALDNGLGESRSGSPTNNGNGKAPLLDHLESHRFVLKNFLDQPDLLNPPPVALVVPLAVKLLKNPMAAHRMGHNFGPLALVQLLRDLHVAMHALLNLELLHKHHERLKVAQLPRTREYPFASLIEQALQNAGYPLENGERFDSHRDAFLIDLIGNTVCADLLDYARRDAHFTNVKTAYDPDRIVENFTLVSQKFKNRPLPQENGRMAIDPFHGSTLRPAIALFTHKLRTDVPSGVIDLLHARFDLYERALFHPTKCVAGAMLGRSLQLIGLDPLPAHMVFLGDQVFLYQAAHAARQLRDALREQQAAGATQVDAAVMRRLRNFVPSRPREGIAATFRRLLRNWLRNRPATNMISVESMLIVLPKNRARP